MVVFPLRTSSTLALGKWHLTSDPTGFDYWNVLPGQGDYYNPDLIEMGIQKRYPGYVTDILTDMAVDFLQARQNPSRPFLLMLHHKAPHRNWQPAERHLTMYDEVEFPEPPTLFKVMVVQESAHGRPATALHTVADGGLLLSGAPEPRSCKPRAMQTTSQHHITEGTMRRKLVLPGTHDASTHRWKRIAPRFFDEASTAQALTRQSERQIARSSLTRLIWLGT